MEGNGNYVPKGDMQEDQNFVNLHILSCNNFLAMNSYQILNNIHQNHKAMHNNHK